MTSDKNKKKAKKHSTKKAAKTTKKLQNKKNNKKHSLSHKTTDVKENKTTKLNKHKTKTVVKKKHKAIVSTTQITPTEPTKAQQPVTQNTEALTTPAQQNKKPIIRKIRRSKSPSRLLYFNADTQKAIIAYQKATEKKDKDMIYVKEIMPAFEKLTENLINIHKFTSLHDSFDDLKNDCVNFLFETIGKFDDSRGSNAFSYFNVVAKNWLIIKTKQKLLKTKRNVSLDDPEALTINDQQVIEENNIVQPQDIALDREHATQNIIEILYDIRNKVKTENELLCINSIITIFENINEIDLLNKSAILLYLRELSGLSPKQLTTSLQNIKKHYRKCKLEFGFDMLF